MSFLRKNIGGLDFASSKMGIHLLFVGLTCFSNVESAYFSISPKILFFDSLNFFSITITKFVSRF